MKKTRPADILAYRYEPFGGILKLNKPEALIWVDRQYMLDLGYPPSELWQKDSDLLSAPTEVHLQPTNRCGAGCKACYVDADGPEIRPEDELTIDQHKQIVDELARMRVFHLALGGGESLGLDDFFDLALHAQKKGLIPSLTTNGFGMTPAIAEKSRMFAATHVSIDGVGAMYGAVRGYDRFAEANHAVRLLREAGCKVGLNTVIARQNADHLEELIAYAAQAGVRQIEFLRFKPAGRAKDYYHEMKLTTEQLDSLYPRFVKAMKKHKVKLLVDCSLAPMLYAHQPDPKKMALLGVTGCLGGNMLMSIRPDGLPSGCSFAEPERRDVFHTSDWWQQKDSFAVFRRRAEMLPEPCHSCEYLKLCRGGCQVIGEYETGDPYAPDPDCLFVREYVKRE